MATSVEQYANLAQSTLSAGISSGDLTLTLVSGTAFPSEGNFRIIIESEFIKVTARSGNVLTIVRGQEGTAAASHAGGSTVTAVITAAALPEIFKRHAFAARDVRLDGADFTQINFGGSSVLTKNGIVSLRAPITAQQLRSLVKTLPAAPYKITMQAWFNGSGASISGGGLLLRDSATGKNHVIALCGDNNFRTQKWSTDTSFSALYSQTLTITTDWRRYGKPIYLQIEDDNVNRISRVSQDGVTFEVIHSVGRTDFLTPDQYGFGIDSEGTGDDRILTAFDISVE
jgi:hypothetical protein